MKIIKSNSGMLKVKVVVFNQGTSSEYYNLMTVPDNKMLYAASGKQWKTKAGAAKWAKAQGFDVVESCNNIFSDTEIDAEDYYERLARGVKREYEKYFDVSTLDYEISDAAITFIDAGAVIYIQPIDEITPREKDLNDDISELADAVIGSSVGMIF